MRTIGVVTADRSDYGIYLPVLGKIQAAPELELHLIVTGTHLSPEFGLTVRDIESDGFRISERVDMELSSDTPDGIAESMGLGTVGFARCFARFRPDILLVLGDRFEMHAAAVAALPFKIPVAHIHGGEITEGAIDDALRHSMTKLSHLHFVSTGEYANRVIQLGEEPWRVVMSGAPGLDNLDSVKLPGADEMESEYGFPLEPPPLLVTFHPVTLEYEQTERHVGELLAALEDSKMPLVFTSPNADTARRTVAKMIGEYVAGHSSAWLVENFGTRGYFGMMARAAAMVGNSSSGIVEAASFELPVVNVGNRQRGRIRGENVIDVDCGRESILHGIRKALDPAFKASLKGMKNPYRAGKASEKIVETLKQITLDDKLIVKRFHEPNALP